MHAWKEWKANFKVSVSNKDKFTKGATWSMELETTDFWGSWSSNEHLTYFSSYNTSLTPTVAEAGHSYTVLYDESLLFPPWLTHARAQHALPDTQVCLASSPILPAIFTGYLPNRGMLQIFIVLMALYIGLRSSVRRGRRGGRLLL